MLSCGEGGSTGVEVIDAINKNTTGVARLDSIIDGFHYDKRADILDIPDTPTEVAQVIIENMPVGVYMIGYSVTHQLDTASISVLTDVEINGVTERFSEEPKDVTDKVIDTAMFIHEQVNEGDFNIRVSLSKETAIGRLDCLFANVWAERKSTFVGEEPPPAQ